MITRPRFTIELSTKDPVSHSAALHNSALSRWHFPPAHHHPIIPFLAVKGMFLS